MGSVPTIARPASRTALHQFDGMTPTTPPASRSAKAEAARLQDRVLGAGGGLVFSWMIIVVGVIDHTTDQTGPKVKRSERSERQALNL